jgi:translocon-associated protein subunit alpha
MNRWLLILLLVTPAIIQMTSRGSSFGAYAAADEDEIEDEGGVEDEDQPGGGKTEETVDDDGEKKNVHSDADTFLLFTKPKQKGSVELPAGQVVEFLVGFTNRGESDFVIETLDASFRYPMDYTYHIQNFSAISYHKIVKPKQEATIAYSFIPADSFAGRPIGLSINLAYRDADGSFYFDPVYNETVQIVDFDEGFDTEVFFMYVFMVAGSLLALFLGFTMLSGKSKGKKPSYAPAKPKVETGTSGDDVDYEWIPRSALRTPGSSRTSPKQRKGKKGASSSDEE